MKFLMRINKPINISISKKMGNRNVRPLLDNTDIGLWDWNIRTATLKISPSWLKFSNVNTDQAISVKQIRTFIHPDDADLVTQNITELIMGKKEYYMSDVRIKSNENKWIWVHNIAYILKKDKSGRPLRIYGISLNITWRKELEKSVILKEKQLKDSEKFETIGKIAGGIAHDYNNSLMGIIGFADLIEKETKCPDIAEYATQIIKAGNYSTHLTQNLLSFARKGNYLFSENDLCDILKEVLTQYESIKSKDIKIIKSLCIEKKRVRCDKSQISKILFHILRNAAEAMNNKGTISISTEITKTIPLRIDIQPGKTSIQNIKNGTYYQISITDSGEGISDNNLSYVFDPFFTTKDDFEHTGMGLAAAYGTVKAHHGYISADNDLQGGAIIKIFLPALAD